MESCAFFNQDFHNKIDLELDNSTLGDDDDNKSVIRLRKHVDPVTEFRRECDYLQVLRYPKVIASDRGGIEKLKKINKMLYDEDNKKNTEFIDVFCKSELDIIFVEIIKSNFDDLKNYLSRNEVDEMKKRKYVVIALIFDIIWKMTDYSQVIRKRLHRQECTKTLLDYISDVDFIKSLTNNSHKDTITKSVNILRSLFGTLHNLSKLSETHKFDFNQLQMSSILLKFVKEHQYIANKSIMPMISIYLTISNVVIDSDIDNKKEEIKEIIKEIIKLIDKITSSNSNLIKRIKIDLSVGGIGGGGGCLVACIDDDDECTQWNIIELLDGLYKYSINDSIKYYIYKDMNIKYYCEKILISSSSEGGAWNEIEKYYILRLLFQLCFDKRISQNILNSSSSSTALYNEIIKLSKNQHLNKNIELNKLCCDLLWSLKKNNTSTSNNQQQSSSVVESTDTDTVVMISYQHDDKDLCLKIKQDLSNSSFDKKYKIIIDVDDDGGGIYGSTLEWMANTIQSSKYIIIFATEKYKLSPNCRAEAEYAFKLNKKIIPCIMQSNYKPDGWLGIIFASNIFIDFTSKSYDDAILALKREINSSSSSLSTPQSIIRTTPSSPAAAVSVKCSSKINGWTSDTVNKWLNEKRFDYRIKRQFQNSNGETLFKFYQTKTQAPEYFYSAISKSGNIEICKVFEFINELEKIII